MAETYVEYTGDGSTTLFTFSVPYISKDHVLAYVDGVETSISWNNDSTVAFDTAPANGTNIRLERVTPSTPIVDFQDGGTLTESDLDLTALQATYLAAEARDKLEAVMGQKADNSWDGDDRRISDVADPVEDQDAVTKSWALTSGADFVSQSNAARAAAVVAQGLAEDAQAAAEAAQSAAEEAEAAASAFEIAAAGSEANALAYSNTASGHADDAEAAQAAAEAAQGLAETAQAAAEAAQGLAEDAQAAAEEAQALAEQALDDFTDIFLGAFATAPTLDNDGDPLTVGMMYFNSILLTTFVYDGAAWQTVSPDLLGDTSPQLGGDLDLNGHSITGTGDIDITGSATFAANLTTYGTIIAYGDATPLRVRSVTSGSYPAIGLYDANNTVVGQLNALSNGTFRVSADPLSTYAGSTLQLFVDGSKQVEIGGAFSMWGEYINNPQNSSVASDAGVWIRNGTGTSGNLMCAGEEVAATFNRCGPSNGEVVTLRRNGSIVGSISVTTTATSYVTSSDHRLKDNVRDLDDGIDLLMKLQPRAYEFKAEPGVKARGFIAHELQEFLPEAVTGEKDEVDEDGVPVMQAVDYSKLTPLLTKALQEAVEKIEDLERRILVLESRTNQ